MNSSEYIKVKVAIKARDLRALADYRERLRVNPRLVYLFLELTNACNLSCMRCGTPHLDSANSIL